MKFKNPFLKYQAPPEEIKENFEGKSKKEKQNFLSQFILYLCLSLLLVIVISFFLSAIMISTPSFRFITLSDTNNIESIFDISRYLKYSTFLFGLLYIFIFGLIFVTLGFVNGFHTKWILRSFLRYSIVFVCVIIPLLLILYYFNIFENTIGYMFCKTVELTDYLKPVILENIPSVNINYFVTLFNLNNFNEKFANFLEEDDKSIFADFKMKDGKGSEGSENNVRRYDSNFKKLLLEKVEWKYAVGHSFAIGLASCLIYLGIINDFETPLNKT